MIVYEINDDTGNLITRYFTFSQAKRFKERMAHKGIHNLHVEKIFQAEDREIRPLKKYIAMPEVH